jgi:hypothetical protein
VGADRPAAAGRWQARGSVEKPSRGCERHPVEAQNRCPLARPALPLRTLADLLRPLRALAQGRDLGKALLSEAQTKSDAVGEVEWLVSVDSTVVRAHQHASGARRKPSLRDEKGG